MNYVTETITPEKAQQYLQTSKGNRPISRPQVRLYADEMKKGNWQLNGMNIIFDEDGALIDGHHRLLAVIDAGIPVKFDVCRGAKHEAFATYDCGRHRNVGQLLAIEGVKNYNKVASIIAANERLEECGRLYNNNAQFVRKSNMHYYEEYQKDKDGYDMASDLFLALYGRCRILQVSWGAGLYYYLTHKGGYTHEEVYPFFDALYSLDTSEIHVCDLLRKIITKASISGKKLQPNMLWSLIAKSWNFYIDGIEPKILRFQTVEEMPTLKIKNKQQ